MGKFIKGQPRPANAGRRAGIPNKRRIVKAADILAAQDINPAQKILENIPFIEDAMDKHKAWLDLLSYCQAKPVFVEDETSEDEVDPLVTLKDVSDEILATVHNIAIEKKMRE